MALKGLVEPVSDDELALKAATGKVADAFQERRSLRERPRQRNIGAPGSPPSRDFEEREAAVAVLQGSPGDHGVTPRVTPFLTLIEGSG